MRFEKLYFGHTPPRDSGHQLCLRSTDFSDFRRPIPDQFWNQEPGTRQRFLRLKQIRQSPNIQIVQSKPDFYSGGSFVFHFEEFELHAVLERKPQLRLRFQTTRLSRISSSLMSGQAIIIYKESLPHYTLLLSKLSISSSVKARIKETFVCLLVFLFCF